MLAMCPNCEAPMCVATKCKDCGHRDRDPGCKCNYCTERQKMREDLDVHSNNAQ
jgi:hypothetical protein